MCQTVKHAPAPLTNEINLILKLQQVRPLFCGAAPAVTLAGGPALSQESAAGTCLWCASGLVPYKDSGGKEQLQLNVCSLQIRNIFSKGVFGILLA